MNKKANLFAIWAIPSLWLGLLLTADAMVVSGLSFNSPDQGFSDNISRMLGWEFSVTADPILVSELGYHDFGQNGLINSHEVGIWEKTSMTLLSSAVVASGTAGPLVGFFRYAPLASPITLNSGLTYVIAGFDQGRDPHVWDNAVGAFPQYDVSGFAVDPGITLGPPGTAYGPMMGSFGFPTGVGAPIGDNRAAEMGPNLRFTVIPEPSSLVFLGLTLGGLATRRRR